MNNSLVVDSPALILKVLLLLTSSSNILSAVHEDDEGGVHLIEVLPRVVLRQ